METKEEKKRLRKISEGNKKLFILGDKIKWSYKHNLNSKSAIIITKTGRFIRYITSTYKDGGFRGDRIIFCLVQLSCNKNPSKIKISKLEWDKNTNNGGD